ncbi:phage virion morphogenesis protein [Gilliamella apis]|uniref:phage virion morphogenesis protein n=1 Tax=Gilliamella apis TaxID=1970738 RepID=UPI000A34F129|nr:phage virion morphogenesis protein [Gilliamella apis]OTQ79983.1 hypothetical protein B6D14_04320 [Gilliamella apis]
MIGVNIEFNVQDALINIEFALLDTHGLFNHISGTLLDIYEARFNAQESPDGITPWQALSPWYQESKPKQKNKILTLDSTLRRLFLIYIGISIDLVIS